MQAELYSNVILVAEDNVDQKKKNDLIFFLRISQYPRVNYFVYHCRNNHETICDTAINVKNNLKNYPSWFTFFKQHSMKSFHVVVLQRTAKKCTKNYNARAQPLNLLFGDFPAAVVVFFNSLIPLRVPFYEL